MDEARKKVVEQFKELFRSSYNDEVAALLTLATVVQAAVDRLAEHTEGFAEQLAKEFPEETAATDPDTVLCAERYGESYHQYRCSLPYGHKGRHNDAVSGLSWEVQGYDIICGHRTPTDLTSPVRPYVCARPPGHAGFHSSTRERSRFTVTWTEPRDA